MHVRWTDGLKALPMMRALDALTDIDRADHNALHSADARTRHRARLQPASMFCHIQRTVLHVLAQSTLGRLVRQMIAITLPPPKPSDQNSNGFKMT